MTENSGRSPLVAGAAAFVIYCATLPPSVMWGGGDFARFQVWAATLHLEGGSLGHPLWVLLAHPFTYLPIGDTAYRASLASAVMAAVAVGLFLSICLRMTRSRPAAWLATGSLAVSHMFWTYSVVPKVYALNSLLLVAALWFAFRWGQGHRPLDLYGLAIVLGAGLHGHLLFLVLIPAFVVYVVLDRDRDPVLRLATAGLLLAAIAAASALWPGKGAGGIVEIALVHLGRFAEAITSVGAIGLGVGVLLAFVSYQFLATTFLLPIGIGTLRAEHPRFLLLLVAIVVSDIAFVFSWIPDPPNLLAFFLNWHFFLPLNIVIALLTAFGFANVWHRVATRGRATLAALTIVLPVAIYALAPFVARPILERIGMRELPGRDNATYVLSPWKNSEDGVRSYGANLLEDLPERSTVLADYGIYWVLRYVRDQAGIRPDVRLVQLSNRLDPQLAMAIHEIELGRRVFIPDTNEFYDMDQFDGAFTIIPSGSAHELVPKI